MKTNARLRAVRHWVLAGVALAISATPLTSYTQDSQPFITSIRPQDTNVVVEVAVPAGLRRITLESRFRFGSGAWVPVAVARTDGTGGKVTFQVPRSSRSEMLRARAETTTPLPGGFYTGTNSFWGPPTNVVDVAGFEFTGANLKDTPGVTTPGATTREVVESDIWKVNGDTLCFFNQYRGLQVIDIASPDEAFVRGTLPLPAAGEQMYLAGSNHVVLLARNNCALNTDESQAIVVSVSNAVPQVVTNLAIPGWLQESRMVGDVLYLASQTWRPVAGTTNTTWEWGTVVSSFDLADPGQPVARGTLWYPGYGNAVAATDSFLFVATQDPSNWWQSVLNVIDITSPDGKMVPYASVQAAGRINDKFKINYTDAVLTTISEDWRRTTTNNTLVTRLETFRLPLPGSVPPTKIQKLAELELGRGEQLHATRFDGSLVYLVTFFRIDPLWIVDFSDPVRPHIAGAVDVPGWSTYIQPLGDRLVSVGIESNRVAVSLFDVHDPSAPGLLSRVRLGLNYSWSEANNDEKAFTVLTDIGLILVPYAGDTTNGWTSRVQLIDLMPNELVARGIIEHQCQPRRAMFHRDRVLSLSGMQLLSVDIADRDQPSVNGVTDLAWAVDRVLLAGKYILELSSSSQYWWPTAWAAVRVASAEEPDRVLARLLVEPMPIVGANLQDGHLYLAQSPSGGDPTKTNVPNFFFTVIDASKLPDLSVLGRASVTADVSPWAGDWEALWPKPGVLVWVGGGANYWWWGPWVGGFTDPVRVGGGAMMWCPVMRTGGGHLLAFDVSTMADPQFLSELNLESTNAWSFSEPQSAGTLVYLSHNQPEPPPVTDPYGTWLNRHYLDVIDYADPVSPTLRKPLNVPGTLQGISHGGEMLYTTSWGTNGVTEWLQASAYDGVSVSLVASLPLPEAWPRPLLTSGSNIFIGRAKYATDPGTESVYQLETWTLSDSGAFEMLGSVKLEQAASGFVLRGDLLATQNTDGSIALFNASQPASLVPIGGGNTPGCFWSDLKYSDGDLDRGLWIPMGMFGVNRVESVLHP